VKWRTPEDWNRAKKTYEKYFEIAHEMHGQGVRFLAGTDLVNAYISVCMTNSFYWSRREEAIWKHFKQQP